MAGTFVQLQLKFNCLLGVPAWPSGPQPNRAGFLPLPEISSNMPLASKPSFRRRLMLLASGNFAVLCGLPCGLPESPVCTVTSAVCPLGDRRCQSHAALDTACAADPHFNASHGEARAVGAPGQQYLPRRVALLHTPAPRMPLQPTDQAPSAMARFG